MLLITNNRYLNKILNIVLLFFVIFIIFSAIFVSNVNLLNESFTNKEKKTKNHNDEDAFEKGTEFSEPVPLKRALKAFSDFHKKELEESRKHHERDALKSVAYH
tara:strand:- start:877 stop:1188 length:312 start_codon:yes stop_codon:yes gene_type:complete